MDSIKNTSEKIKGGWNKMDPGKRKALILIVSAVLLFVVLFSVYSRQVTYATLFQGLELEDAAAITADLDTRGNIRYKIENGGRDILIDEKHVDKYRLELAMNGMMPDKSTGFEIFDNMGMMVTDEDRKIMYQRGLEGELQRSIMSLTEIESARVHLVLSEESIFDTERREASASVILSLKTGAKISADSVRGIIALVTGAVNNLPEEKVQVIDTRGNLLSFGLTGETSPGVGLLDKQSEVKRSFEKEIENNILNLLGPAFGPDKLKVAVYADLDFDAQEQTVIAYRDPVIRSEQNSAEGPNLNVGEITDNPIDDNTQNVLDGEEDGMGSYEGTKNYELTETTTRTVRAPGKVQKISTSVLFDGNLTEAQLLAIRNLVSTATGYDLNRGDLISVESMEFDKSYQEALEEKLEEQKRLEEANRTFMERYGDYIYLGVFSVLGLVIVLSVIKLIFGKKKRREEEDLPVMLPQAQDETLGQTVDIIEEVYQKFEVKENQKEKQLKEYAEEHPEIAADLIKAWMKE
ncbi:flagellar basal-body MS-ring/collar protein FliF [Proteiniclasticum ruminis]|uniref:flagellar basal-body MS-ring/collar protein FliF n=1 Tax=Proteiniclasticum ruminis TaxID=398199 RepID=UPI0028A898B6|nr:flagellar basal-body MS-ring/collar protein FliF [Proteiniclasticum ruminis]